MRGRGYPNLSGTGMGFNFSSLLGMGRVTGKYIRTEYGDMECKTHPHPAPLPCLLSMSIDDYFKSCKEQPQGEESKNEELDREQEVEGDRNYENCDGDNLMEGITLTS